MITRIPSLKIKMIGPFFFVLMFLQSCQLLEVKDKIITFIVDLLPLSLDETLGDMVLSQVLPESKRHSNEKALSELRDLLLPLTSLPESPKVTIWISTSRELNAFAVPGGHLVFNQGLLEKAAEPDEILGVAAHEMAHVIHRHSMRSLVQSVGLMAAVSMVFGDVSGLAALVIDQGSVLLQRGFSRSQEKEADTTGFNLLVKSRLNPKAMTLFFERIKGKKDDQPGAKVGSFWSTHPITSDRIEAIEALSQNLPKDFKWKKSNFDLSTLKKNLEAP